MKVRKKRKAAFTFRITMEIKGRREMRGCFLGKRISLLGLKWVLEGKGAHRIFFLTHLFGYQWVGTNRML